MKLYSYACATCAKTVERLVSESEKSIQFCNTCKNKMERVLDYSGLYTIKGNNSASTPPKTKVKK